MRHPTLQRQLRRAGLTSSRPPTTTTAWASFLARMTTTCQEADRDRETLEQSLTISSAEMRVLYEELRSSTEKELAAQEDRLRELGQARERLERSEANFKMVVDRSPHPVFVHQGDVFRYVNAALVSMLGYDDASQLIGMPSLVGIVHPDDEASVEAYRRSRDAGLPCTSCEMRWMRRDGGMVIVEARSARIAYDDAPATLVIAHDITSRIRASEGERVAQDALRSSEERYRTLFDSSPVAMMLFEPDTFAFIEVNDRAVEIYGYSRSEMLGMTMMELKPETDHQFLVTGIEASKTGRTYTGVHTHRTKAGALLQAQITSRSVFVRGRRAVLAFMLDVTKTRQLEEQLRQAQKMEAIGQLAGGVAHDFNNILGVILSDADLALETLPDDHPAHESVVEIAAATERAAALTKQLLTFSRRSSDQQKTMFLDAAIREVMNMISRVIGENIRIVSHLGAASAAIVADGSQIEQVLLNLAVNARDAMPDGGTLLIETRVIAIDGDEALVGLPSGEYLELVVGDDGCGMDAETCARIFEPFFTTKDVGKGTGLGLATVFGIVQQSRGSIRVRSALGLGTQFIIHLPRVASRPRSVVPSPRERLVGRGETILVVEDEAPLRAVICRVLKSRGYVVVEAPGPAFALEVLRSEQHIDLVLTDLVMPGMDGRTMALEMLCLRPTTRFVYMSGYAEHVAVKSGPLGPDDAILGKPFTPDALAGVVHRALRTPNAA